MTVHRTCPACWREYDATIHRNAYYVTCPHCRQNNIVVNKDAEIGRCRFCFGYLDDHHWSMEKDSGEFEGCERLLGMKR